MKYCSSCGSEVFENAVLCTKCGCLLPKHAHNQKKNKEYSQQETNSLIILLFRFITLTMAAISLFFCIISAEFRFTAPFYSGGQSLAVISIISSGVTFCFGVSTFVMLLVKKSGLEKILSGVLNIIFATLLFIVSMISIM